MNGSTGQPAGEARAEVEGQRRQLIVPRRFRGPSSSANGGWTSGAMAVLLGHDCPTDHADRWPAVEVTLRRPPPLETPLRIVEDDEVTLALEGALVVAEARTTDDDLAAVEPVSAPEARAAMAGYPGHRAHPFPECFSCGPARAEGDGLRIFPGPVGADPVRVVAAAWTPDPSLREDYHVYAHPEDHGAARASVPVTWAALDCIGGWAGDLEERPMVLGRMAAQLDTLPVIGSEHVLVARRDGASGRRTFTASTLYDARGRVVARARHVWVTVDPTDFGPAS